MASAYAASASNTRPIARRTGKCGHAGSVIVDDNAAHATPAANHTPSSIEPCREAAIAAAIAIDVPRLAAVAPSARAGEVERHERRDCGTYALREIGSDHGESRTHA